MPIIRNHNALDGTVIEDRIKDSWKTIKRVVRQTPITEQRPKVKMQINYTVNECLIDTGVDVTIITTRIFASNCSLF